MASVPPGPFRPATRWQSPFCRSPCPLHLLRRPQIGQHSDGRRETLGRRYIFIIIISMFISLSFPANSLLFAPLFCCRGKEKVCGIVKNWSFFFFFLRLCVIDPLGAQQKHTLLYTTAVPYRTLQDSTVQYGFPVYERVREELSPATPK